MAGAEKRSITLVPEIAGLDRGAVKSGYYGTW
jgi:hypothetical protein